MFEEICRLKRNESINAIRDTSNVFLKKGIWNEYKITSTEDAIDKISNKKYCECGASVYYNDADNMYYVSIPHASDMW